mmetsp:Transcript_22103/g.86914  ORF Transcript_22103/g.86914 Transcript_22103/m.86914 type:complete len:210 (-) Transcript_22103:192-821(-)
MAERSISLAVTRSIESERVAGVGPSSAAMVAASILGIGTVFGTIAHLSCSRFSGRSFLTGFFMTLPHLLCGFFRSFGGLSDLGFLTGFLTVSSANGEGTGVRGEMSSTGRAILHMIIGFATGRSRMGSSGDGSTLGTSFHTTLHRRGKSSSLSNFGSRTFAHRFGGCFFTGFARGTGVGVGGWYTLAHILGGRAGSATGIGTTVAREGG